MPAYGNIPVRRRLGAGLNSVADSAKDILGMYLSQNFQDQRLAKTQNAELLKNMLEKFNTDTTALSSPESVDKLGPDRVAAQYANLKRRLPKQLQGFVGQDPDFKSLQRSGADRVADFTKELGGIDNPDNPELTPEGIRNRAASFDLSPDIMATMGDPFGKGSTTASSMGQAPEITNLIAMADKQRHGLLAKEPKIPLKDFSSGTEQDTFTSNRDMPTTPVQAERTPQQEAARQGAITSATQQATADVATNPANVKKFASKAAAEAYARTAGANQADAATKVSTQVVEGQDENGNKTWSVINTSPSQVGQSGSLGPAETVDSTMRQSFDYANRATQAHNTMLKLEPFLQNRAGALNWAAMRTPNMIKDPVLRQYAQATAEYINAKARRESGATINPDEYTRYVSTDAYNPGDDEATMAQKQDARRRSIQGLAGQSGKQLGRMFVTSAELATLAKQNGDTPEDEAAAAEAANYRVIR